MGCAKHCRILEGTVFYHLYDSVLVKVTAIRQDSDGRKHVVKVVR